jgi:hypothetical protein
MAGFGAHWARQMSLATCNVFFSHFRGVVRPYLMRWRNTTPRATVRRVIRRGLGGSPGIGEVILAIMARMCSSL